MDKVILGRIGSPYGIKGWSKIISFTDPPSNIINYPEWFLQSKTGWKAVKLQDYKIAGQQVLVKFDTSNDRDQAKTLTNCFIAVDREVLPKLPPDEFYWQDLIGLQVINLDGFILGQVTEIQATGSNDVMLVKREGKRHVLPYTSNTVKSVDLENKIITVDWDPNF